MNKMSIQISDSQKEFLAARAAQEGLGSPSDYVQELIRAAEKRNAWAALETAMQVGFDSGEPIEVTEDSCQEKKARFIANHPEVGQK
jgi:Arc/MetJ-type ribon-helix-helix transcriptional regulator